MASRGILLSSNPSMFLPVRLPVLGRSSASPRVVRPCRMRIFEHPARNLIPVPGKKNIEQDTIVWQRSQ
jgi:hypothetical protein